MQLIASTCVLGNTTLTDRARSCRRHVEPRASRELKPTAADNLKEIFEERRLAAEAEIARIRAVRDEYGDDKPSTPSKPH
jgi:hypothetical protein